jgi:hypothetical protein
MNRLFVELCPMQQSVAIRFLTLNKKSQKLNPDQAQDLKVVGSVSHVRTATWTTAISVTLAAAAAATAAAVVMSREDDRELCRQAFSMYDKRGVGNIPKGVRKGGVISIV